jgi:hypothetical protein
MAQAVTLDEARALLGKDFYGPQEIASAFRAIDPSAAELPIPYRHAELEEARKAGEMLILRIPQAADRQPITIVRMIEKVPDAFDQDLLHKAGYQLKSDWGITLEPLAQEGTCELAWSLVRKEILDETRNLSYDEQSPRLREYAARLQLAPDKVRRRTATEAVFDTIVAFAVRGERLLETTWDWTSSETVDGGFLNVGGFGPKGMQTLSFSAAVRHAGLGACPTRSPRS